MNPFELTGFSFLFFYVLLGVAVLWGLYVAIRQLESATITPQQNMTDPYLIAHLRAGANEALRVATVALLDRGLLTASGTNLTTKNGKAFAAAQRPIEKAILHRYAKSAESHKIFTDAPAKAACNVYEKTLQSQGLIADMGTFVKRLPLVAVGLAVLIGVAWNKVNIAFSQGRHNVGFLIFLALVFSVIALVILKRRRTGAGDAMLADLRSLFSRLKDRAKSLRAGGATNEAALLAAVFGLSALTASSFPFLESLYPKRSGDGSSCGASSCSSSSSCSSGSSCSGGCGGGGCGG